MAPRTHDLDTPPRTLLPGDAEWPEGVDALTDPPEQLRVVGKLPRQADAVAIVGTRYADPDALDFATQLAADLAAAGCTIVSGGAWGVDAAAHRGALDAGGQTVVVMPTGFDRVYPARHRGLFAQVPRSGGGLVTELPDGTNPARWTFLQRNRLIAALARVTVVVQAPLRSGAMSTAAAARKLEKPVFSVPYAPWEARGEGCLALLADDAQVCTSARDILSVRPSGPQSRPGAVSLEQEKRSDLSGLDEETQLIYGILSRHARHPDDWRLQRTSQ